MFPELIDGVSSDIVIAVIAMGVACLQFFFSWKWDNLFAKLAPTLVFAIGMLFCFLMMALFGQGLEVIGWLVWWIISLIMLVADGAGWLAYAIYRMVSEGNPNIPEGM
jgi:hypothetical protein